jgi:hypothetical protein
VRAHVESQIIYWRAIGKQDWAEALEQCLAKAERCQSLQDAVLDLWQRLEAERERKPT